MPAMLTPETPVRPTVAPGSAPAAGFSQKVAQAFAKAATAPAVAPDDALTPPAADASEAPDTEATAQPEAAVEAPEAAEPETPEAEADAEAPEAEPEAPAKTYEVEVTLPGGDGDGRNQGRFVVELPNQQVADAIRFAQKQAARVPHLQDQLDQASQDATMTRFLSERPLEGMLYVGQQRPEAAQQFVQSWLQQYPQYGAQVLAQLGYLVDDSALDPQRVSAMAELARMRATQQVASGQAAFQAQGQEVRYAATAQGVWQELAGQLGLEPGSVRHQMFASAAIQQLVNLASTNQRATRADMALALQPLVREFQALQGVRATAQPKTPQPRDGQGQFTKATANREKFQKLQPPATAGAPLKAGSFKMQPGESMDQWKARLRRGGV